MDAVTAAEMGVVEAVPFAKDILSGVEAAAETFADEDYSIEEFKEKWDKNKEEWNQLIHDAEAKHPLTFNAADFATSVGLSFIPGAAGVKGAVALGAASGLSRSEERSLEDALIGGGLGFLGHKAGEMLSKGVARLSGKISSKALGSAEQKTGQYFMELSSTSKRKILGQLQRQYGYKSVAKGADIEDAVKAFGKDIHAEGLIQSATDTPEKIYERVFLKKEMLGEELDKFLYYVDDLAKGKVKVNSADLYDDLYSMVETQMVKDGVELLPHEELALKKIQKTLAPLKRVDDKGNIIDRELGLAQLPNLKRMFSNLVMWESQNTASNASQVAQKYYKQISGHLHDRITETAELVASKTKVAGLSEQLATINKRYSNLATLDEVMSKELSKVSATTGIWGAVRSRLQGARAMSYALGAAYNPAAAAAILSVDTALGYAAQNNPALIRGLTSLAKHIKTNPNSQVASRFARAVLMSGDVTPEYLDEELKVAMAGAALYEQPIERTNEALIRNANAIASLIRDKNPDLAQEFHKAMEQQDEEALAAIGSAISRLPEAASFIKPGKGWNGKLFSQEEIQAEMDNLETTPNISYAQQLFHKAALKKNRIVPQVEPEIPRYIKWKSNKGEEPPY